MCALDNIYNIYPNTGLKVQKWLKRAFESAPQGVVIIMNDGRLYRHPEGKRSSKTKQDFIRWRNEVKETAPPGTRVSYNGKFWDIVPPNPQKTQIPYEKARLMRIASLVHLRDDAFNSNDDTMYRELNAALKIIAEEDYSFTK